MYFSWCLCDYCVLVFLCCWESINKTKLDKRDYGSNSGSSSIVVGVRKHPAASFRETHGRSGGEDDNANGVGYVPPEGIRDFDLGFLIPHSFPFRLSSRLFPGCKGSIGTWFTFPLCGNQGRYGLFGALGPV